MASYFSLYFEIHISINQFYYTHIKSYKDNKLICQKVISKLGDGVESLEINLI